ncbi:MULTISPECIES: 50S ribosomal protein L25/general stress protein Ctc [Leucobacter]|uniref:Large ribosomal subunit protein bL25 n=2 Tax=Leucobacter TaxID=55968 RepID=A0ABP5MZD9_9MICO|nr:MULTISPECIES: 50S ribosomal protein L25/general stress protein Ctc [Leucobacter]MBS3180667.1 50S ribosomal protein L25/general stress protein Ctc [Leucobacter manosquensis]
MSETSQLVGHARENFGKGAARKLRAAGQTPAVVYGHGTDPIHVAVDTHPLSLIIRQANALIELDVAGEKQLVLVKDVQKDPVRQIIEHVDLIVIKQGETVEVEVRVHVTGESFSGTNALQELNSLHLSAPAASIPDSVEVSVEGLEEGAQIHAGDIELPEGATLLGDPEQLVVNIVVPRGTAEDEDEAAEAAE